MMGSKRSQSSQNLRIRAKVPNNHRDTLLTCPACDGQGQYEICRSGVSYSIIRCRWCDGLGCVEKNIYRMFTRWLRIANYHRLKGQCPK